MSRASEGCAAGMAIERLIDIYEELARSGHLGAGTPALCTVAAEFIGVSGAGVAILSSTGLMTGFCTSDDVAKALMDLEETVGEGPCVEACTSDGVIAEPDLHAPLDHGWLSFAPLALAAGAQAVFGVPVRIGAIRLGALSLYAQRAGSLTESQSSDAYLMASVVGRAVLALQAGAPVDSIGDELVRRSTIDYTVHQAAGMVAVQGAMTVGEALARIRAHAFATDAAASTLAGRIVFRETIFDALSREWRETGASTR
jgi:hypothetical protein